MIDYDVKEQEKLDKVLSELMTLGSIEMGELNYEEIRTSDDFRREAIKLGLMVELPIHLRSNANLLKEFLQTKKFEGCSSSTILGYADVLTGFLNYIDKSPLDIKASDIREYLIEYQRCKHCGNRTIDNMRLVFSSFYGWLETEDYILKNPVKKIKHIKYEKILQQPFTDEELTTLRDSCKSYRDVALIDILYSTGCRVSEICSLDIEDINFNRREIKIFGKGKKERIVYFDAKTKIHLANYIARRRDNNPALFVRTKYPYNRMDRSGVEFICREIGNRAGVKHCHPHRFRRTLATNLIDKGVPIEQVQVILGHTKIDTTLIYANVNQENVKLNHHKFV